VIGLVAEGAVEQDSGPEKYVYVITAAGYSAMAEWFESCITKV
jgi:DNA-binding PadR family transcriptional regulator